MMMTKLRVEMELEKGDKLNGFVPATIRIFFRHERIRSIIKIQEDIPRQVKTRNAFKS